MPATTPRIEKIPAPIMPPTPILRGDEADLGLLREADRTGLSQRSYQKECLRKLHGRALTPHPTRLASCERRFALRLRTPPSAANERRLHLPVVERHRRVSVARQTVFASRLQRWRPFQPTALRRTAKEGQREERPTLDIANLAESAQSPVAMARSTSRGGRSCDVQPNRAGDPRCRVRTIPPRVLVQVLLVVVLGVVERARLGDLSCDFRIAGFAQPLRVGGA